MTELAQPFNSGLGEIFDAARPVGQAETIDVNVLRTYIYRLGHVEETEGKYLVSVCRVLTGGNGEVLIPMLSYLESEDPSALTTELDIFDAQAPYPVSPYIFMRQIVNQARFIRTGRY
jgi:hypothetical protein